MWKEAKKQSRIREHGMERRLNHTRGERARRTMMWRADFGRRRRREHRQKMGPEVDGAWAPGIPPSWSPTEDPAAADANPLLVGMDDCHFRLNTVH